MLTSLDRLAGCLPSRWPRGCAGSARGALAGEAGGSPAACSPRSAARPAGASPFLALSLKALWGQGRRTGLNPNHQQNRLRSST